MTLEEAKIADKLLLTLTNHSDDKISVYEHLKNNYKNDYTKIKNKYLPLLIGDGYLYRNVKRKKTEFIVSTNHLSVTDIGISFILFKGGYTKMIKDSKKEKSNKIRKYWFDVAKDVLLIILSIISVVISIIYA